MKAEIMTVTPEMAKEFLKGNTLNRAVSDHVVTQYASDMKLNRWRVTGSGISIAKNSFTFADYVHFCTVLRTGCIVESFDAPFIGLRDALMTLKGGGAGINHEIRLRVCYAIKQYLDKSSSRVNKLVESDRFSLADFI